MIWHYHNAGGLLLVASAPYSMLLSPSLLPFFRSSSHPRAVFCASTHTFLGWWGGARSRAPLFTTPLPPTAASPSSPNCRHLPAVPATLHPRPNYEDQYTRKLARAAPTLLVCRPSSSVDLRPAGHTHRDRRSRAHHRSSISFFNPVRFHAHMRLK